MTLIYLLKKKIGFSLMEVLIAMAILSLVFITISLLITKSLSMSQHADDRTQATNYLQETMEYYRLVRDQAISWDQFTDSSCNMQILEPTPPVAYSHFTRLITPSDPDSDGCADNVQILVTIEWEDRYNLSGSTVFANLD